MVCQWFELLVWATPVSICSYNGVVENDDILSLFTANRKLPMATDIRTEFSDCQWYQWQPMTANVTNGKITNGTIGKTPNARKQNTVMNHSRSTALERSVIDYWVSL